VSTDAGECAPGRWSALRPGNRGSRVEAVFRLRVKLRRRRLDPPAEACRETRACVRGDRLRERLGCLFAETPPDAWVPETDVAYATHPILTPEEPWIPTPAATDARILAAFPRAASARLWPARRLIRGRTFGPNALGVRLSEVFLPACHARSGVCPLGCGRGPVLAFGQAGGPSRC
jgi:hypothetical protein